MSSKTPINDNQKSAAIFKNPDFYNIAMKYLGISASSLFLISFFPSCEKVEKSDMLIFNRIEYIYSIKAQIEKEIWPHFADNEFNVPLVYYTDSNCYVVNPTNKFIHLFNPKLVYNKQSLSIYKTTLLDSIPFHMETGVVFGDSCEDYNYKSPFMYCSSPEMTHNFVPDVTSTELWVTMVMHEYFHGFQFKHVQFLEYYTKSITVSADSLEDLYKNYTWFKEGVDKENELLLKALNSTSQTEVLQIIAKFFELRDQRNRQTCEFLSSNIKIVETFFETMEGTARYIEYSLYSKFATMLPDLKLIKSDSLFHSYEHYKNYSKTKEKWLYLTNKTKYYYATGFNIARLLDKLGVSYKSRLFNEKVFLDEILREQIKKGS
ncbi:MAG: hypothetical protein AB7O73_09520 [Bacteroidia bacterium]